MTPTEIKINTHTGGNERVGPRTGPNESDGHQQDAKSKAPRNENEAKVTITKRRTTDGGAWPLKSNHTKDREQLKKAIASRNPHRNTDS